MKDVLDILALATGYKGDALKKNPTTSMNTGHYYLDEAQFIEALHIFFRNRDISVGSNFLDMGSGLGVKPAIACSLGLNAYGIELNRVLSETSQRFIKKLREEEYLPKELECKIIRGSYFPNEYIKLRKNEKSIAKEIEDREGFNRKDEITKTTFFPYGNHQDIYEQIGVKIEEIDLFYRYGWKQDVPALWEIFSKYAKKDAALLHFSADFPGNSPELLERLNLSSSSGYKIPRKATIIRKK